MMTLSIVHGSPNCRKALATVRALALDVELRSLDFVKGDLQKPEFKMLNPNAMVPVLTDGEFVLWESNAIMQYLCDKTPRNRLLPTGPRERANVTRWQYWAQAHFNRATETFLFERLLKPIFLGGKPDENKVAEASESFHRFAPVLDQQLKGRDFIAGDDVTLADFAVAAPLAYAEPMKLPLSGYGNIRAWYQRVERLPAWQESAPPAQVAAAIGAR